MTEHQPLAGRVALVAGATRGAGRAMAVELARAVAYVYATGRSSRTAGPSEIDRPETIEETGDLMRAGGGDGRAVRVDHLEPTQVESLVRRIDDERGGLDVLVNDIFGGDRYSQWDKPLWEHDLTGGLRMLRLGVDTHLITSATRDPPAPSYRRWTTHRGQRRHDELQRELSPRRRLLLRPGEGNRRPHRQEPRCRTH